MLYHCNTLRNLYPFDQATSSVLLCLFWGEYNTNSWHLWYQYKSPTTALVRGELCSLGPLRHIFKPICFSCFHKAEECHQTSRHHTTTLIPEMELKVLRHCGNRNLWSEWKDATHGWVPRASTKVKHSGAHKVLLPCFLICDTALKQPRSNCCSKTSTALKPEYFTGSQPIHWKLHVL